MDTIVTANCNYKINKALINVAYADDHTAIRESIIGYLHGNNNIRVTIDATNGAELLDKMLIAATLPDVCLLDIHMPVMNGFILLREIKKRWPDLPCIMLTGTVNDYYIEEAIKLGANAYLTKSCPLAEIAYALKALLQQPYYYNDILTSETVAAVQELKYKTLNLTEREITLLKDSCTDLTYAAIAKKWGTTYKTIDGIRERLGAKLQVRSRAGLMLVAIQLGYFTL